MSELEEVSFWPGSTDGSYSRVGPTGSAPMVSCRRRTVLIIAAVVAVLFLIGVAVPAGLMQHYKTLASAATATTAPHDATTTTTTTTTTTATTTTPANGSTPAPPHEFKWNKYRLPNSSYPTSYELTLNPALTGGEKKDEVIPNDGTVSISIFIANSTDFIVLHAKNITVTEALLQANNKDSQNLTNSIKANTEMEQIEITLDQKYPVNATFILRLTFNTSLSSRTNMNGFYATPYTPKGSDKETVIGTTQFESVYARRAFPCYDEPAYKATFKLTIYRPKDWISLFNTPLVNSEPDDKDANKVKDIYEASPKMSSYLVAFMVCDFKSTEYLNITSTSGNNISIKIYGQESQVSQLEFARTITGKIVSEYEQFFNVSYPLEKLDIVAVPDFAAGAMENWGLILFRESDLLYDDLQSSSSTQQLVTYVIAHELAHQWFGNYVTMQWWNELWLNEGFATWVGKLIGTKAIRDQLNFTWPVEQDYKYDVIEAFETDALRTSHPLSLPADDINSIADIENMFDSISYVKGAAMMNMLDNYVSRNKTQQALQKYLQAHSFGSATAADLWEAFDQVQDTDADPKAISTMMDKWTHAVGYPKITANTLDTTDKSITVNQSRYLLCDSCSSDSENITTWDVPITYKTANPDIEGEYSLKTTNGTISLEGAFTASSSYQLNTGWDGYYQVQYTFDIDQIKFDTLEDVDQAGLIFDILMQFKSGVKESGQSLVKLLSKATLNPDGYLKWRISIKAMSHLLSIYDQSIERYSSVSSQVYQWLNVSSLNLTYDAVDNMTIEERNLMSDRLRLSMTINHTKVHEDIPALASLTQLWTNNITKNGSEYAYDNFIHKDLIERVAHCSFLDNELLLWNPIWNMYNTSNIVSDRTLAESTLARGRNHILLNRYLDYSLNKARSGDTTSIIRRVSLNKYGRTDAWAFILRNWNTIRKDHGDSGFMMRKLIRTPTQYFSKQSYLDEMKDFFDRQGEEGLASGLQASYQALEIVQANINMIDTGYAEIEDGLKKLQP